MHPVQFEIPLLKYYHWMRDTTTDVLHLREIATCMLPLGDKTSKELPLRDITIEK